MPKEVIHWIVAERTAARLASGPFGPSLARCPQGLRFGSVLHDVLFYLTGNQPEALKELPHVLHGAHGEDTFALLRAMARHVRQNASSPLPGAVFVGLASHIFADATLHPFVYHHTGNYYDPDPARRTQAVRRHRTLECLMDMVAQGSDDASRIPALRFVVDGLEGGLNLACPPGMLAELSGQDAETSAKALRSALDTYCTMQSLCRMQSLAQLLHEVEGFLPAKAREVIALFYAPQLYAQREALAGTLSYQNPATGENLRASLDGLMTQAAERAAAFCAAQAPAIAARGELAETGPGPSLDMGVPSTPTSTASHFAPRPLLRG